ncbi:hypothetical protein ACFW93_37955 [Streptomyces canus]|uniref:hypothetical protein n=1 Tax=Streptomyces canus TaxID=58343 RepID=UPI0036932679
MEDTQMPKPLRRAIHQLVAEAVQNCQEVLTYTEPFVAHHWKRKRGGRPPGGWPPTRCYKLR